MHKELLDCKGVVMSLEFRDRYEEHFIYLFETFQQLKPESHRRDGLILFRRYLEIYYDQVLKPIKELRERDIVLRNT